MEYQFHQSINYRLSEIPRFTWDLFYIEKVSSTIVILSRLSSLNFMHIPYRIIFAEYLDYMKGTPLLSSAVKKRALNALYSCSDFSD